MSQIECRHPQHNSQPIISICSERDCHGISRLCCTSCLLDTHKHHIDYMIKLEDILKLSSSIKPLINWPKDPVINNLAIYFTQAQKKEYYNEENHLPFESAFNIIEGLLDDLMASFSNKINELRFSLKQKFQSKSFGMPLNTLKLQQIYEDVFDLTPVKGYITNYLSHFCDYYKLEQNLKSFFCSQKFIDTAEILKKQINDSSYQISYDNFKAFKTQILNFLDMSHLKIFLLSLDSETDNSNANINLKKSPKNIKESQQDANKINQNTIKPLISSKNKINFLGKKTFQSYAGSDWIYSVEYLYNTHYFASAGADKSLKLWDLPTRTNYKNFSLAHSDTIKTLHFIPNARLLASGSFDGQIKLWDPFNHYLFTNFQSQCIVNKIKSFDSGKKILSAGDDNLIKVWDIGSSGQIPEKILQGHQNNVQTIVEIPEQKLIASGSWDKMVKLWDLRSKDPLITLKGHADWVQALEDMPQWEIISSGAKDGEVKFWDLRVMKCFQTEIGLKRVDNKGIHAIQSLTFMKGMGLLAIVSGNKVKIKIMSNLEDNDGSSFVLEGHNDEILDSKFIESSQELLTCSKDKTICIWN